VTTPRYTRRLIKLARRAARVGCYIDVEDTEPGDAGPYVLRCCETGYDAHESGCDLQMIDEAILQIELEEQLMDKARDIWGERGIEASLDDVVESITTAMRPEARARAEAMFRLGSMVCYAVRRVRAEMLERACRPDR
jgi:hypothetical protein